MKNITFLFFGILCIILISCQTESELSANDHLVRQQALLELNKKYLDNNIIASSFLFENKADPTKRETNLYSEFREHSNTAQWKEMHEIVKSSFSGLDSEVNPSVYYDYVLSSYEMLNRFLNKASINQETNEARIFYLDILLKNQAGDLNVMTPAVYALYGTEKYDEYKTYILKCADSQLLKYEVELNELEQFEKEDTVGSMARDKERFKKYISAAKYAKEALK